MRYPKVPAMIDGAPITALLLLIFLGVQNVVLAAKYSFTTNPLPKTHHMTYSFIRCFTHHHREANNTTNHSSGVIYTLDDHEPSLSYDKVYTSSINNGRFLNLTSGRPVLIVAATHESHVQATVICGRKSGLRLRVRSGGHDFEGLSYREVDDGHQFIMLDLGHMRSITVDAHNREAWVEVGATIGDLYWSISKASPTLGFPAGICLTLGVGGHISGGGFGLLMRKYGLAADNVLDARMVDVRGRVLDRTSMGEDLFWALRGGGGASFGVVLAFRVKLVEVTPKITVFSVTRNKSQGAIELVTKWQHVAYQLPDDMYLRASVQTIDNTTLTTNRNVAVIFWGLFLGEKQKLLSLIHERFPELGIMEDDCKEMSYVEAAHFQAGYAGRPLTDILDRRPQLGVPIKGKYDYVNTPISKEGWEGIFSQLEQGQGFRLVEMEAYGGGIYRIPESAIPFPHRKGVVYRILYMWIDGNVDASTTSLRNFFQYMTPFVSKNPRGGYINCKDLDLGRNSKVGKATYEEAISWGSKYFNENFRRLAVVKARVDPDNYFWNEQSIPPYI